MLEVGNTAPDLDLHAVDGSTFRLRAPRSLCTLVYFFHKAFGTVCVRQAASFRDDYSELLLAGARLVGVSTDDLATQRSFAAALRLPFPMIADADLAVSSAFGVLFPFVGRSRRVTFAIGPDHRIEAVFDHELLVKRHRDDVLRHVNDRHRATRSSRTSGPARVWPPTPTPSPVERRPEAPPPPSIPPPSVPPPASAPLPSARPGAVLGERFEIVRRIASGGFGHVYLGRDQASGAPVAIKVARDNEQDLERFEREATLLAELRHPAIVDYVAHRIAPDGDAYLVTEWIEGETLGRRMKRLPLSVGETVALARRVAAALGAAHARGIVHRDLKPGNLMLPGGEAAAVKLLDFGIARLPEAARCLTRPGFAIGTLGYMAPEQARCDRDIDARADVFALGCVLYRCLCGRPPFQGDSELAVLVATLQTEVPDVRASNPAVPAALSALVSRMLSKAREDRPADAAAVAAELDRIVVTAAPAARPLTPFRALVDAAIGKRAPGPPAASL